MNNFEFYNPVKILFGKDQLKKLPLQIPHGQKNYDDFRWWKH